MPDQKSTPNFGLILGYDPLQAEAPRSSSQRAARTTDGRHGQDRKISSRDSHTRSSNTDARSLSSSSAASSMRRGPPSSHPRSLTSPSRPSSARHLGVPIPEQPGLRDSISDDRFVQAYYEPSLRKLSDDWQRRLAREHESDRVARSPSAASSLRRRQLPRKLSFTTSRSQSSAESMPAFHVRILGHPNVGKSSFIASVLGVPMKSSGSEHGVEIELDGQPVYIRLTERAIDAKILYDPSTTAKIAKDWDKSPERVDGAIILYDVTDESSTVAIPSALRSYNGAGIPSVLVATKGDSEKAPQRVNSELFGQKAIFMDKVYMDQGLTVLQTSLSNIQSPRNCLDTLVQDIMRRQTDDDRSITQSRPSTRASKAIQGQGSATSLGTNNRPTRAGSDYSSSSAKESEGSGPTAEPLSPTSNAQLPRPKLAAEAAEAARREKLRQLSRQNSSQNESNERLRSMVTQDESDESINGANEDADDEKDAAILSTQQTFPKPKATFDDLVDQLVLPFKSESDAKFVDRFLAFFRMFASAQRLLEGLITRCIDVASGPGDAKEARLQHIFKVLSAWIKRYPGDFALVKTSETLDEFLSSFGRNSDYAYVGNIRLALSGVDETDDTYWGVMEDDNIGSTSSLNLSSSHSSNRPPSSPHSQFPSRSRSVQVDESFIFKSSALTLNAMGPSSDTASLTSARTKERLPEIAQRQAVTLVPDPKVPLSKDRWRSFLQIDDMDIAKELTRIDWVMFSAVKPRELIRDVTVSLSSRGHYPDLVNVSRMIDHFNHVASWTVNLMLLRDKPKHRAQMWQKLARVARKLRALNNYNSLGAIVAGMEGTAVHRLAATKALIPEADQKDFMKLQILMNTSKGHFAYRMAWDNTTGARVPFLPLHRRDLVVAEQGNKTFLSRAKDRPADERVVNWTKFDIMGSILTDLQRAQATMHPNYRGSDRVKTLLLHCALVKDEDELYERSTALEPAASGGGPKGPAASARRRIQPWLVRYGLAQ